MILYEVTVVPEPQLADAFATYMRTKHIAEVLATQCFASARFDRATSGAFRTSYFARSQEELDRYLNEHASRLRADFVEHFPAGMTVTREVWTVVEEWDAR